MIKFSVRTMPKFMKQNVSIRAKDTKQKRIFEITGKCILFSLHKTTFIDTSPRSLYGARSTSYSFVATLTKSNVRARINKSRTHELILRFVVLF